MTRKFTTHPLADIWPMLPDDELAEMAESIRQVGLLEPIVVTPDGVLLDGRNRLAACKLANVEPTTVVFDGDDVEFIVGRNSTRRHMTTGQRAMAVATVLAQNGRRRDGRWARGSVLEDSQVPTGWVRAMAHAGVVLDHASDLTRNVIDGALALDAAYKLARERASAVKLARLSDEHPDLAAQVREMPDEPDPPPSRPTVPPYRGPRSTLAAITVMRDLYAVDRWALRACHDVDEAEQHDDAEWIQNLRDALVELIADLDRLRRVIDDADFRNVQSRVSDGSAPAAPLRLVST